ncbi:MAG: BLUF domain-containing protein [Methylicorpusculum sp.]|uniref:BLUF domain-containing protein n=1 Tax=Methylicorpusculum sp. TaxID=2713644 RepID=UPI00272FF094|nr:BLUF domain-containing protein [Methylicorpusculum sp.]MDP2177474.1 BLUF domain-containing protein [Methylicorpusculum sp.]
MNASLFRLIYISRNEISGDEATLNREIDQILASSRVKNPIENITGALMFNAGCFAQVLEGSHNEIQNTFERIQCDPRHSHVVVLAFEPTSERSFSNWSMAYFGTNSNAAAKFGDIANKAGFDPSLLEGDRIFDLLKEHLIEAESASHRKQ